MLRLGQSSGYSLIEAVVATALTVVVTSVIFVLVEPARASFRMQLEGADMHQRIRVTAGACSTTW